MVLNFYSELGYDRAPTWDKDKPREILLNTLKQLYLHIEQLTTQLQEHNKIKIGQHTLSLLQTESLLVENPYDIESLLKTEYANKVEQELKKQSVIDLNYACEAISRHLTSNSDICTQIVNQYNCLVVEEPENMNSLILKWFSMLPFKPITVCSIYPIKKSKNIIFPSYGAYQSTDYSCRNEPNTFMGKSAKIWRQCSLARKSVRSQYADNFHFVPTNKKLGASGEFDYDLERIKDIASNQTWNHSRILHLSTSRCSPEQDTTGVWLASTIVNFCQIFVQLRKTQILTTAKEQKSPSLIPSDHGLLSHSEEKQPNIFLSLPSADFIEPDNLVESYSNYLLGRWEILNEMELDIRYIAHNDGPVNVPSGNTPSNQHAPTLWIGSPLNAQGCEFDFAIIPYLQSGEQHWPSNELFVWDWLDLCCSKAKYITAARAHHHHLVSPLRNILPQSYFSDDSSKILENLKIYFTPLYQLPDIANINSASLV